MVAELDGLADFFLFLGKDCGLSDGGLELVPLATVGTLGGVGLGVVAGALVLLLRLALEKIESLVHALPICL